MLSFSPDPPLPGILDASASLAQELAAIAAAKANGTPPRTRHLTPTGAARYTNRLAREASPYLLQHAHNPVNWFPWGDEAFARAARDGKLVFLSVGYATCHWCHVMEEESFEDEEIAAFLNRHFIPVKVDREERPDVDHLYMTAVQLMTGQGGWPMTVFLTADRRAVVAGTYLPPRDGERGAPVGLLTLLREVARQHEVDPEALVAQGDRLTAALVEAVAPQAGTSRDVPALELVTSALARLHHDFDPEFGGFGGAPKFPRVATLTLLAHVYKRSGDRRALRMLTTTLDNMAAGGIRDHLDGGFHRYSVDRRWRVPHFEKMLYDNAQLASIYLAAYQLTGRASYAAVARETLDYLLRDMAAPSGNGRAGGAGFFAASDADSPGAGGAGAEAAEGAYYTWTREEIAHVLGPERTDLFCDAYGVAAVGTLEGGRNVLRVTASLEALADVRGMTTEALAQSLATARRELAEARRRRPPPLVDTMVLAGWNGLALSAFSRAALVLDDERGDGARYAQAAQALGDFLTTELWDGRTLARMPADSAAARQAGFLDDYAFVISGLLDLLSSTGTRRYVEAALAMQQTMDDELWDEAQGGYFLAPRAAELMARSKPDFDGAEPAGNSVAAASLLRLAALRDDAALRERAGRLLAAFASPLTTQPLSLPQMLSALLLYHDGISELVLAAPGAAEIAPLLEVVRRAYLPETVLVLVRSDVSGDESERLGALLPSARGRAARDGRAAAYLCRRQVCGPVMHEPEELRAALAPASQTSGP